MLLDDNSRIPKIIHHIAPKDRNFWHPIWKSCYQSWIDNFSQDEYVYMLWNDAEDIDNLVKNSYNQYWKFYKNLPYHIMKIDMARLLILHKYGGIYSDMDVFCYKNFFSNIKGNITLMEASCRDEIVQNCLMSSIADLNFFIECVELIKVRYNEYDKKIPLVYDHSRENFDNYVKKISGPSILEEVFQKHGTDINLFPKSHYNCNFRYYSDKLITRHFLTGVWGSEIIKEFIFDSGDLDMDKIMGERYENFKNFSIKNINFYKNYV